MTRVELELKGTSPAATTWRMEQHFSEYVVSTIGVPDTARSPVAG